MESFSKVMLVTPDWLGKTSWNWCESWRDHLMQLGVLHSMHCVNDTKESIDSLFTKISQQQSIKVLLVGGDHHLAYLHDSDEKQQRWRETGCETICVCMERVVDSPFPESLAKTKRAIATFDKFVYMDEFAKPLFEASGKPSWWSSQFADHRLFRPRRRLGLGRPKIYMRAHSTNFGIPGVYADRLRIIEQVRESPLFAIHSKMLSPAKYARDLGRQQIVLRTPSNCPGWVENFWTAMASRCVVIHSRLPKNEVRSQALLTEGTHYLAYDPDDPESLSWIAKEVTENLSKYQAVANAGFEIFRINFTVERFVERLMNFASTER